LTPAAVGASFGMREQFYPSRPNRLETRRRGPRDAVSPPRGGAEGIRPGPKKAPAGGGIGPRSLDTGFYLETSVDVWNKQEKNRNEIWNAHLEQKAEHDKVTNTFFAIFQSYGGVLPGQDPALAIWRENYDQQLKTLPLETGAERWQRVEKWKKDNPPWGRLVKSLEWERAWARIEACGKEWVVYRAACCEGATDPVAVPIGCGHRLCPFCNWRRSQDAYRKLEALLPHLEHPEMITLTTPNVARLTKEEIRRFRARQKKFLASYEDRPARGKKAARAGLIRGGLYSMECTRNYVARDWHLHSHILCDLANSLPMKSQKVFFAGEVTFAFNVLKWRMEFDWLRLWSDAWGREPGLNASKERIEADHANFEEWARQCRENTTKTFDYVRRVDVPLELPAEEMARRTEWNRNNRRVMQITPVDDRKGALKEAVKYITKGHGFTNDPEATEEFCNATKGARMVQTFGTWYGIDLGDDINKDPGTWEALGSCQCGECKWERAAVVGSNKITMAPDGRWILKAPYDHKETGIVRPTARGLAGRRGREPSYVNTDERREQDFQQFKREWGTGGE
jgi:hypothetical protein